jgi:hypothetical protein
MAASRSHHGPVALTTTSADTSPSAPVTWSWVTTPVIRRLACSTPVTSVKGRSSAPPSRAVAKKRSGSRMASMVASGTHTAALRARLRPGSRARAWAGRSSRAGMPQAAQAATNPGL